MERKKSAPVLLGANSLLTIFAVLCLVVFTMLSIATVQAQRGLARRSAQAVQQYYAADARAHEILSQLRSGEIPGEVSRTGERYSYTCTVSDSRYLAVEVEVTGDEYRILRWQEVAAPKWEETQPGLWDGSAGK